MWQFSLRWIRVAGLGACRRSEVQEQCDFTHNTHPVGSRVQGNSGSGSSAFSKSHLSPSRSRFITAHRAIFWTHSSTVFPSLFSFCGRKRATLVKAQYVTDTTPTRAWGPIDKYKRQSSQFCRGYRPSQPCCGYCNATLLDVSQTWKIKWLWRRGRPACDYSSRATAAQSGVSCPSQAWAWTNQSVFELTKGEGQEKMEVSF